ncbi:hypothetical protein ACT6QG_14185 [Xanthobacter sp. TB0136]|uniref:hypothetical protein n=1 Tax=Xanthobacter sp. TB0136 TaxID=3459177 RepID=UPI00403A0846
MKSMCGHLPPISGRLFHPAMGAVLVVCAAGILEPASAGEAASAPLPKPSVDYSMTAKSMRGARLEMSHHKGKMRVEMKKPGEDAVMTGIIDLETAKMLTLVPAMPNMAMEVELPPQYAATIKRGTGRKVGEAEVAGESCDLWHLDDTKTGETVTCITSDGIALRSHTEMGGAPRVLFEAERVTRAPQDPAKFSFPPEVQIIQLNAKTIKGIQSGIGALGGLGGLGGLLQQGQGAAGAQ